MTLKVVRLVEDFRSNDINDEASEDGDNECKRAKPSPDHYHAALFTTDSHGLTRINSLTIFLLTF
jgi:hypothetical protein